MKRRNKNKRLRTKELQEFQTIIWHYYTTFGRRFDWRMTNDPYHIFVSEIMLQQTQTFRIDGKFQAFINQFPSFAALAQAELHAVIKAWQGLGYNRRALALKKSAQKVMHEYDGILPDDPAVLVHFPGIGKATAASICAFAFNKPTVFIETNIRSVYLHFFFAQEHNVDDKTLMPLVAETLDKQNPREWYYALMDYGVMIKQTVNNPSKRSKHHAQQSSFEGSDRQVRGLILKILTRHKHVARSYFMQKIERDQEKVDKILHDLKKEGLIKEKYELFSIA